MRKLGEPWSHMWGMCRGLGGALVPSRTPQSVRCSGTQGRWWAAATHHVC